MRTLAKEFRLSDVGLAKICEKHQIPRPPEGHWVGVERGYDPEKTPLPDLTDAKLNVVNIPVREKPLDALGQNLDPKVRAMLVPAAIAVQSDRSISHPLVLRTKQQLAHGRKDERGLLLPEEGKLLSLRLLAMFVRRFAISRLIFRSSRRKQWSSLWRE
jgi:hypothetical protein